MLTEAETFPEKARLDAVFNLEEPDRIPCLGGWIADPGKIMALSGANEAEYWANPVPVSIRAYQELGLDGLLDVNVPSERGGYTLCTSKDMEERAQWRTPEDIVSYIESLPSPEEAAAAFDVQGEYEKKCANLWRMQELCGPRMWWCPARWEVIPNFEWYRVFGYENYLVAIVEYGKEIVQLYEHSAALAACHARVVARMVREGIQPIGMLCGMDICGQYGPMVDPGFLREHYFPLVREAVKPLRDAGARLVWHCDGDVRPILDDIISLGVGGLQGFQEECGVRLEEIVERRTLDGDKLLIFGPISVTKTLVSATPEGVRRAVRRAVEVCRGKASLVLKTSNEILPDVPLENLRAMYDEATGR
ncbi:MAG: uroporphyrinogen decarboxylase family protein [bacterium]|nr:hypothetical protein [Candidatus Sumerlaeota bacterium]